MKPKQPSKRSFLQRTRSTQRLGEALGEIEGMTELKSVRVFQHILEHWAHIAGPLLALHTRPITIENETLLLTVMPSLLTERRADLDTHFRERLKQFPLKDIRLIAGAKATESTENKIVASAEIESRTEGIKDEALRDAMTKLIATYDALNDGD